jgi:hypothetical protein
MKQVDNIEQIRTANNKSWMDLLRLAIEVAPKETAEIVRDILIRDKAINAELSELLDELERRGPVALTPDLRWYDFVIARVKDKISPGTGATYIDKKADERPMKIVNDGGNNG